MSESAYYKVTIDTTYPEPLQELEYFLHGSWDVWSVELLDEVDPHPEDEDSERRICTFNVIIFELSRREAINIIAAIKKKAEMNNVEMTIEDI